MTITLEQARTRIRKVFNYGYAAMDGNGLWCWYLKKPKWDKEKGKWVFSGAFTILNFMRLHVAVSPENSLIRITDTEQRGLGFKY